MSTLILTLPLANAAPPPEYDYVLTSDGQQITAQGRTAASLLPATAGRGAEVVAVIPARALSWHGITLPERVLRSMLSGRIEPARARGVLAGVLEEQLLDDSEKLHFAVFGAPPAASGDAPRAWVAACDRAWLCLNKLWNSESHFNPKALNMSSHAFGIAQFLPTTWGNYKVAKTVSAKLQIQYGLRYIQKRYGRYSG